MSRNLKSRFYKFLGLALLAVINTGALHAQTNPCPGVTPGQLALIGLDGELPRTLIPLVAIVMACCLVIIVVALRLYFRHEKNKMLHQTIRSMVDKGVPIPPELFTTGGQRSDPTRTVQGPFVMVRRPHHDLRRGLLLVGIGIGLIIVTGRVGWIVFFVGVAFLVVSIFTGDDQNNNMPPKL